MTTLRSIPRTLVALHAHPDDEALLTGGTLAAAAAAGHRVVLVVATDGALGEASEAFGAQGGALAATRRAELDASAAALGVARVVTLGHADSGSGPRVEPDPPGQTRFVRVPLEQAAGAVAAVLAEEHADVLLSYDRAGGYGHRDHVRVHEVGARAAELVRAERQARGDARPLRVLEATVPRDTICRALDLAARVYPFPPELDRSSFDRAFSARAEITHRIDVHRQVRAKRAALRAHASQASGTGDRTVAGLLRLPRPLADLVLGREWYRDPQLPPGAPVRRDVFADCR